MLEPPPHPQSALGSEQRLLRRGSRAQARTRCTVGGKSSRVLGRTPRSCHRGRRDFPRGAELRLSLGPPSSALPLHSRGLGGRCSQQPTPSAVCTPRGRRGREGRPGLRFSFSESLNFAAKFPGRRLCPRVGASHRRSFPSLFSAPARPASRSLRLGLAASPVPERGPRRPQRPAPRLPPTPLWAPPGCLSPGRHSPTWRAVKETPAASRGTPNTIHTALMRL
ncbi:uncharacterized protein [Saccopteryx leptura]|uniref:uncharacterized protein n=1 Tax=Saccopteryx leptura TaxID=249018 RepID=UPI00339CB117